MSGMEKFFHRYGKDETKELHTFFKLPRFAGELSFEFRPQNETKKTVPVFQKKTVPVFQGRSLVVGL